MERMIILKKMLVVEDSDDDFETITRMVKRIGLKNPIQRCTNGEDALNYLFKSGKYKDHPDLMEIDIVLLDLNMPGLDGRDVLKKLRADVKFKKIPIVILTNSSFPKDIKECYELGANTYVQKPVTYAEFERAFDALTDFWLNSASLPSDYD